jgi:hypothetical protein
LESQLRNFDFNPNQILVQELSGQIAPRGQSRARGEPPVLGALSDRPVDLGGQRDPSGAIELDGEGSHRAMVQPRSASLVLFYGQAQRICSA